MERVYAHNWMALSKEYREHLIKVFGIIPTGIREVIDMTQVSDGVTNKDLEVITSEKMIEYVGSTEPFSRLWDLTLMKVKYELNPPFDLSNLRQVSPEEHETIKVTNEEVKSEPLIVPELKTEEKKKFCDSCDSKGIAHKKECIKRVTK